MKERHGHDASRRLLRSVVRRTGAPQRQHASPARSYTASSRAKKPFVVVDCGSIPPTLAEATLFGHERGAFTGAVDKRLSPFQEADGGTIFLDELGELPLEVQPKLLRALAERRIKSVGSNTYREVDVRVLAATRRRMRNGCGTVQSFKRSWSRHAPPIWWIPNP